jgi:hypothetical protein
MIRYTLILIIMISLSHCATTDVVSVGIGFFND